PSGIGYRRDPTIAESEQDVSCSRATDGRVLMLFSGHEGEDRPAHHRGLLRRLRYDGNRGAGCLLLLGADRPLALAVRDPVRGSGMRYWERALGARVNQKVLRSK